MSLLEVIVRPKQNQTDRNLRQTSPPVTPVSPGAVTEVSEETIKGKTVEQYLADAGNCVPDSESRSEPAKAEWRFWQPHARLFPFIGRKVRTPGGPGTLVQVFENRVTVVLDTELLRCSFYAPAEIEPITWRLAE